MLKQTLLKKFGYKRQLRELKKLAIKTCAQFPLNLKRIDFLKHGENTTYKITDSNSKTYLLRIHGNGYHSTQAIKEEIAWLKRLAVQTHIIAPEPIKTKKGTWYAHETIETVKEKRNVTVFKWVEGRQILKSVNLKHIQQIAELLHTLHKNTAKTKVRHRLHYWTAKGLAGRHPFIGPMDRIVGLNSKEQGVLNSARKIVYTKLSYYEKANPKKMGLIHADLHFGNFFNHKGMICPIDFDDCGHGFYMYDLAVLIAALFQKVDYKMIPKKKYTHLKHAFLKSYDSFSPLSQNDLDIIADLRLARRFIGTQWLNLRSDNPRLKAQSIPYAKETVKILKKRLKI